MKMNLLKSSCMLSLVYISFISIILSVLKLPKIDSISVTIPSGPAFVLVEVTILIQTLIFQVLHIIVDCSFASFVMELFSDAFVPLSSYYFLLYSFMYIYLIDHIHSFSICTFFVKPFIFCLPTLFHNVCVECCIFHYLALLAVSFTSS